MLLERDCSAQASGGTAIEDYLKTIWGLTEREHGQVVSNAAVAERRLTAPDVQPPRPAESRPGCPYPDCRHDGPS